MGRIRRFFSFFVSVVVCLNSLPSAIIAEQVTEYISPTLVYRAHIAGTPEYTDEEGWVSVTCEQLKNQVTDDQTYTTTQTNLQGQPLDTLEVKLLDTEEGVFYQVRDGEGRWSGENSDISEDCWMTGGSSAEANQITGIAVKLSEDLDAEYDVCYRVADEEGEWLAWHKNGEGAVYDVLEKDDEAKARPVGGMEIIITKDVDIDGTNEITNQGNAHHANSIGDEDEAVTTSEGQGDDVSTDVDDAHNNRGAISNESDDESTREAPQDATQADQEAQDSLDLHAQSSAASIEYRAHVQRDGWQGWVKDGAVAGTSGRALRVEGLYFKLSNAGGDILCDAHVQRYGWMPTVHANQLVGTQGKSLRIEAIKLSLSGAVANSYDIWYRVHVQRTGWQGWKHNGEIAGTTGSSLRIEAIEVLLVTKGGTIPTSPGQAYHDSSTNSSVGVHYQAHVQKIGWQGEVSDGALAGTSGRSLRVEALRIKTTGLKGGIEYQAHVQTYGWMDWVSNGSIAGTTGKSLRVEALRIRLNNSEDKAKYNVYYRTHVQGIGWTSWMCNGDTSGTVGQGRRLEAIQIVVRTKSQGAPGDGISEQLNGVDLSSYNWDSTNGIDINTLDADFVIVKATQYNSSSNKRYTNPYFKTMANQTINSGKLLGLYHYATGANAIQEADFFCDTITSYKGKAILCLDWEDTQNPTFGTGVDVMWCKTFLDRVKSRMGGSPLLYLSKSVTAMYNWSSVSASYGLWGAQYASNNPVYGYQSNPWQSSASWGTWGSRPLIHQYSGNGWLSQNGGSNHPFDLNVFYGMASDWKKHL